MEAADEGRSQHRDRAGGHGMTAPAIANSSRYSYYVTDESYGELVEDFSDWQDDERSIDDPAEWHLFRRVIEREARLLDRLLFEEWLTLYTPDCFYWVPSTPNGGDPRREIAVMFDDRRRLEDRVYRLRTGYAWSQAPSSRTSRMTSNVEVFSSRHDDQRMVRSNFAISEFWDGETRVLSGWTGHRLRRVNDTWLISAKQVNLLNCDQCIRNPSIIF
jgi:benzoate/toluate 1,2-dioxygenase beta subunit